MGEEEYEDYQNQIFSSINSQMKDLEEKQKNLKNRLLLLGENLLEIKEKNDERITEIKKELEILKNNMERLISFLEMASEDMSKFARKEDVELLAKQARMFQPLNKNL
jgi:predicted  nucleic acid-binding Zn-ribbon protein